ncbi:MAG: DUF4276 family protein [Oscillospiraceae bacterium]|nr:DUF4276 family protein [Oscillospiraceae bacterium]MDD4367471.1 DUF4276 family protein [Oscillospiraceae bacterium]
MPGAVLSHKRHIEVLVEDRSGGQIVSGLLRPALARRQAGWTYSIRRHRGVGHLPRDWQAKPGKLAAGLLQLLPAELKAYRRDLGQSELALVLVVLDADDHDSQDLFRTLKTLNHVVAPELPVVIGIAVEELEAWLLADRSALLRAYPEIDTAILDQYEQDSVCGTWEVLARAILGPAAEQLIKLGYPAVGQQKSEWAAQIAPGLEPQRINSPSFKRFYQYLTFCLDQFEAAGSEAADP